MSAISLKINTPYGKVLTVQTTLADSVLDIKKKITKLTGTPVRHQTLYTSKKDKLDNNLRGGQLKFSNNDTLILGDAGMYTMMPTGTVPDYNTLSVMTEAARSKRRIPQSNITQPAEVKQQQQMLGLEFLTPPFELSDEVAGDLIGDKFWPNYGLMGYWTWHKQMDTNGWLPKWGIVPKIAQFMTQLTTLGFMAPASDNRLKKLIRWFTTDDPISWKYITGQSYWYAPGRSEDDILHEWKLNYAKGNYFTPSSIATGLNVIANYARDMSLIVLPTIDDLFIVTGQDTNRQIIDILKTTQADFKAMKDQNIIDFNYYEWDKSGEGYFPSNYYSMTFLVNYKAGHSRSVATLVHNTIITLKDRSGKIVDQFVKLFDEADLWSRLQPPDRNSYRDADNSRTPQNQSKFDNPFQETTQIKFGMKDFLFHPVKDETDKRGKGWRWSFNGSDLNIIIGNANGVSLFDMDKYFTAKGLDKTDFPVGKLIGIPYQAPTSHFNHIIDYFLKINMKNNANWVRLRKPLSTEENKYRTIIINEDNSVKTIKLYAEQLDKASSHNLSDKEIKRKSIQLIDNVETLYQKQNAFIKTDKHNFANIVPFPAVIAPGLLGLYWAMGPAAAQPVYVGTIQPFITNIDNLNRDLKATIVNNQGDINNVDHITLVTHLQTLSAQVANFGREISHLMDPAPASAQNYKDKAKDLWNESQIMNSLSLQFTPKTSTQQTNELQTLTGRFINFRAQFGAPLNGYIMQLEGLGANVKTQYKIVPITISDLKKDLTNLGELFNMIQLFGPDYMQLILNAGPQDKPVSIGLAMGQLEVIGDAILEVKKLYNKLHNIHTRVIPPATAPLVASDTQINQKITQINGLYSQVLKTHDPQYVNENSIFYGLGWMSNEYKFPGLGGGAVTLNASDIGQLAAAQIIYKSEGVLMMETLLGYLQNPFRAPIRWLSGAPKITPIRLLGKKNMFGAPIRWLTTKSNQEATKDILVKFVMDEIDNTDLITEGVLKLIRIVHPTSSKWSRSFGTWTVTEHSNLLKKFIHDVRVNSAAPVTIPATAIAQGAQNPIRTAGGGALVMYGGCSQCGVASSAPQTGGGCGCEGGGKDFNVKAMVQGGGANGVIGTPDVPGIVRYQIDPNKVNDAIDKLIMTLISKENAQKEAKSFEFGDELSKLISGREFEQGVLVPLSSMTSLAKRVRWLSRDGNKQLVKLLLPKLYTEAISKNKRDVLIGAIDAFVGYFEPTGTKKYSKAAQAFNALGIREQFMTTMTNNPDAGTSATRALVDRLLLIGEGSGIESAVSADDVEKNLNRYLNQLSVIPGDDRKRNFITKRAQSFQLAWVKYTQQFGGDEDAVTKKLSKLINMFREFRDEKPNLIETFMVTAMNSPRGGGNVSDAVNALMSELVGAKLALPSKYGYDPAATLTGRRDSAYSSSPGSKAAKDKLEADNSEKRNRDAEKKIATSESEFDRIMNWIDNTAELLTNKMSEYEAEFNREAGRIRQVRGGTSEVRRAEAAFRKLKTSKDREYAKEIRKATSLTSSQKTDLDRKWKRVKDNLATDFAAQIRDFKSAISHNATLAKAGLRPDSQKNLWDWGKDKVLGRPSVSDYKGLQRKAGLRLPGQTGDRRSFQDILGQRQTGRPALPPGPIGAVPRPVSLQDLQIEATKPGFATYKDPVTGQTKTVAVTRFPMETSADYARLQKAIMTLDPAKIKQFMAKLGDVASTLPAHQAAKILDHFQRRVLNELDKYCIRQNWMLFDENLNKCV